MTIEAALEAATRHMSCCHLCPRDCGVNRAAGERGYCGLDDQAHCFREMLHPAEEAELSPSHQVYFTGCNLRCEYCTVREWNEQPLTVPPMNLDELVRAVERRRQQGARNVNLLGGEPTVSLPGILTLLQRIRGGGGMTIVAPFGVPPLGGFVGLPAQPAPLQAKGGFKRSPGLFDPPEGGTPNTAGVAQEWTCTWARMPIVLNTNMYYNECVDDLLRGQVDVCLADLKCGNSDCAAALLDAGDYVEVTRRNLRRAAEHTDLIVRHLLLPGHLECCARPTLEWLASNLPRVKVSVRTNYVPPVGAQATPAGYVTRQEAEAAGGLARDLGLHVIQ